MALQRIFKRVCLTWHTLSLGVVQDSVETALNSSGDVFFTATAEELDRKGKG